MKKQKPALSKEVLEIRAFYKELRKARVVLTWDEFADKIKKDRTYISRIMNGHEPLTETVKDAISSTFGTTKNVPHGTYLNPLVNADLNSPLPLGNLVVTLGDYVDLLKKQSEVYQKIAETNLGTILKNQEIGGGIVQELLERDVLKEAKGNPKKAAEILEAIRLKIAKTSGIALIKYIHDGEGIAHK